MKLHLDKELFKEFIENLSSRTKIDSDIIEKDYYVSIILKDLSIKQDYLQAYFKGGTALYKILDTMNRFSEDIDLTVMVLDNQSNTKNGSRLKESALGYKVDGLELSKNECTINKGNVIGIYKYDSAFNYDNSLHKAGIIQVESTSFTVTMTIPDSFSSPSVKLTVTVAVSPYAYSPPSTTKVALVALVTFNVPYPVVAA